jgi:hypothetical protein
MRIRAVDLSATPSSLTDEVGIVASRWGPHGQPDSVPQAMGSLIKKRRKRMRKKKHKKMLRRTRHQRR